MLSPPFAELALTSRRVATTRSRPQKPRFVVAHCRTAAVALAIGSFATSAHAQTEPIRVTYSAPPECSSESAFLQEVTVRTPRARRAMPDETARAFAVTLTIEADTTRGRLAITSLDGSLSTREVTGETCGEVVSALALMTALSIDPMAIVTPGAQPPAQESGTKAAPSDAPEAADSPGTASQGGRPVPADVAFGPPRTSTPPAAAREGSIAAHSEARASAPGERPRWSIGGGGRALTGLTPGWGLGGEIFVAVEGKARGHFVPAFRASLFTAATSAQFGGISSVQSGTQGSALPQTIGANLLWILAGFEACPVRFARSTELSASLCAALEGGVLHSSGASVGLQTNEDVYKPWVAPAALGRGTWGVSDRWFVEGAVGVTVPLVHYQFYYRDVYIPSVPVYDFPPVGAMLALETGYRFP